jgi:cytohesin
MPMFECTKCGYTCGSARAWARHTAHMGADEHVLTDPTLASAVSVADITAVQNTAVFTRALDSWVALEREAGHSVESKITLSLEHDHLPIVAASRRGNVARLKELLQSEPAAELSRVDAAGMSAVAWAAKTGNDEVMRLLLDAGASPTMRSGSASAVQETHQAPARVTDDDVVEPPPVKQPPAGDASSEAQPPLYLALTKGHSAVATRLLEARADPSEMEPVRGQSALHAAASAGSSLEASLLKRLLHGTHVASPLPADFEGFTPLHAAAANGQLSVVEALLSHPAVTAGAELCRVGTKKLVTPLAAACRRGHADVARRLVHVYGACVDSMAVRLCLQKGRSQLLLELLKLNAPAPETGAAGAEAGTKGGIAGIDGHSGDGVTALMLAAEEGDETVLRTLLALDANPEARDQDGHTALHRASFYGHAKLVQALLTARASVDTFDHQGNSALHHAGRGSQEHVFDLLELRFGADTELLNRKGEVPKLMEEPCRCKMQ